MKIMRILLVAFLVVGFGLRGVTNVSAVWICTDIATDSGTGRYQITTANDLISMACWVNHGDSAHVDGVYELKNDIDLTGSDWIPIGTSANPFTGEFYGGFYKLSNMNITTTVYNGGTYMGFLLYGAGMFGYVSGANIVDLRLINPTLNLTTNNVSAIDTDEYHISLVGVLAAAADNASTIHDVDITNASVTVTNPENLIQMNSFLYTILGGLLGRLGSGSELSDSSLTGSIDVAAAVEDVQYVYMGGLVGTVESSVIRNSWFMGDLSFSSPDAYELNELTVGGIAGSVVDSIIDEGIVGMSTIDVNTDTHYAAVGGIAGSASAESTIFESTAHGEFTTTTDNLGGIVGFIGEGSQQTGFVPLGIIYMTLDTNNVMAELTGHDNVGGLVGKTYYNVKIMYGWFEGTITGHSNLGGLVGQAGECKVDVMTSFSLGTLTGSNNLGGIIGMGYSENVLTDVFSRMNLVVVEDPEVVPADLQLYDVGGIAAYDYGVYSIYTNVYFAGTIVFGSLPVGNVDPISNFNSAPISITSVYYDHDLMPVDSDYGTPKTTAELKILANYVGFTYNDPWVIDPIFNEGYAYFYSGYYRVTVDDGMDPYGFLVRYDSPLLEPEDPIRDGYVFGGWFTDSGFTDPWDFAEDEVTGDVTLTAKWTAEIPDTGEEANFGMGLLGIGLSLLLISKKTKKQS